MSAFRTEFLTLLLWLIFCVSLDVNSEEISLQLYQDFMSGKVELESLSEDQKKVLLTYHKMISRTMCEGCSDECRDAKQIAESYRSDLALNINKLMRCLDSSDLLDDCYSEFRRVKRAHDEFESGVSKVSSYCE